MSTSHSSDLHEKIRVKAYLLWEKAGCPPGDGSEFWVEAEKVIVRMAKLNEARKAKALAKPAAKALQPADPALSGDKKKKAKKEKPEKEEKKKDGKKKKKGKK